MALIGSSILKISEIFISQGTRQVLGTQQRTQKDLEAFEDLKANLLASGQSDAIVVQKVCAVNPICVGYDASHLYCHINGATRIRALLELAEEGHATIGPKGTKYFMPIDEIKAFVKPSLTEEITQEMLAESVDSDSWDEVFKDRVKQATVRTLGESHNLNMGVKWDSLAESNNMNHQVGFLRDLALTPANPFSLPDRDEVTEHQFEKLLEEAVLLELQKQNGLDLKEIRERLKFGDPNVTQVELQDAYREGLIGKSAVKILRRVFISPIANEEGEVTNQDKVDEADQARADFLELMISQKLTVGQLRDKIEKMNKVSKIKENSRDVAKPKKVSALDEETAEGWLGQINEECFKLDGDSLEFAYLSGAYAGIKLATTPAVSEDAVSYILDEAEEHHRAIEEDKLEEPDQV